MLNDKKIDCQVWNSAEVEVWGPTRHSQTAPALPDFCDDLTVEHP